MKFDVFAASLAMAIPALADLLPHAGIPDDQFNYGKMAAHLEHQLGFAGSYSRDYWVHGWLPQSCKDMANEFGLDPNDFTVFSAHYADCDRAWIFCRHKDSAADEGNMLEMFGRTPVGMRQFVRHLVGLPSYLSKWDAQATPSGDVRFFSRIDMPLLLHEVSHSMDWYALSGYGDTFSSSRIWSDAYYRDSHTPSEYGRANWMEDFAEAGKCGVADANLAGGFGSITDWWPTIQNQYMAYEWYFGAFIKSGGSCTRRFANSATVQMSGNSKRAVSAKPEDSVTNSSIATIQPKPHLEGQITACQLK